MIPADPHILQAGVARSGNMWLYHIISNLLERSGVEKHSYIKLQPIHSTTKGWPDPLHRLADIDTIQFFLSTPFYIIGATFRLPILDFDRYVTSTTHVWTHSPANQRVQDKILKFDKVVYIIRDPRDALISHANFLYAKHMSQLNGSASKTPSAYISGQLHKATRWWVRHVASYLTLSLLCPDQVQIVFYEQLREEFTDTVHKFSSFLDLTTDPNDIAATAEATSFQKLQQITGKHLRVGTSNQWVTGLSPVQQEEVLHIAGPMLDILGYPRTAPVTATIPRLPTMIDRKQLQQALLSSRRRTWQEKRHFVAANWRELLR